MAWLLGMLALLPIRIFHFPANLELVDLWVMAALPVLWMDFILSRRAILGRAYLLPIFLILVGSFASALAAPSPYNATIPIVKEIYLFVWFVTLATVLSTLGPRRLRTVLLMWVAVATAHGLLIIAQFLFPEIWRLTTSIAGQSTSYADYRSSGLFLSAKAGDANKAAVFQLLGFVPLLLARPPKAMGIGVGTLLLCSILGTGSMGVTLALTVGVVILVLAVVMFGGGPVAIKKHLIQVLIAVPLLLGSSFSVVVATNQDYREHLESIIVARASKSSGGRFDLWARGVDALAEHKVLLWGVGAENFREVDPTESDNQLHNDFLAFTVERGLIGVSGLVLFALVALNGSMRLRRTPGGVGQSTELAGAVFLAAFVAVLFVSLTHQIFHTRALWILLAVHESVLSRDGTQL